MIKYFAIGVPAFIVLCAVLAPASLLRPLLAPAGLSLAAPFGTVWSGGGELRVQGRELGSVEWFLDSVKPTEPALAYHWKLFAEETHLHGSFAAGPGLATLAAEGGFDADAVNPWLRAHGLRLSGQFHLPEAQATFADGRVQSADGRLEWSGGSAHYQLGGAWLEAALPPLAASVQFASTGGAEPPRMDAQVLTLDGALPLIQVESTDGGYVKIGVTRRLLKMAQAPWLGDGADDALALTLEEKLF